MGYIRSSEECEERAASDVGLPLNPEETEILRLRRALAAALSEADTWEKRYDEVMKMCVEISKQSDKWKSDADEWKKMAGELQIITLGL